MKISKDGELITLGICHLDILGYDNVKKEDGSIKGHRFKMNKRQLVRLAQFLRRQANDLT